MRADEILKRRCDRAIAIILHFKEDRIDPLLPDDDDAAAASHAFRKVVLDQLNDFRDIALDIAQGSDAETTEYNPEIWEQRIERRLNDIHRAVAASFNGDR
jgi:hypothetical protein